MAAKSRDRFGVRLSVLDRLVDPHPDQARDPPTGALAISELLRLVQRDLELLLNARRPWALLDRRQPELQTSPLAYGLNDVTAGTLSHGNEREAMCAEIESLIRRFEPRLMDIRVTAGNVAGSLSSTLPLTIEALLRVDPEPEPVRFGTVVDPASPAVTLQPLREE